MPARIRRFRVTVTQLTVTGIVIVLVIAFTLFLRKTKYGIQLRAVSQDRKAASLMGIDVNAITMLGNAIGCGMGGIAGLLFAVYYNNFRAIMGGSIGMKAFSAATLGGLGDISVASAAGMIISIFENIGIALTGTGYRDMVAFLFLIVVLMVKPSGIALSNKPTRTKKISKGGNRE